MVNALRYLAFKYICSNSVVFDLCIHEFCSYKHNTAVTGLEFLNSPVVEVIMKNQKDNPAVTARDLNLGDDEFILYRINEGN